jgi:serine/threonine-protein kinase HipA
MDRHAVIWTRLTEGPVKMGDLVVTTRETRFSYTPEFLERGVAGLALLSSPRLYGRNPVVFQARDSFPLHPRLMELIPGEGRRNLQRRIYTRLLDKRPQPPAPGFDTDWELLLLAGQNGIGHLDLFRDDRAAEAGYQRSAAAQAAPAPGSRSRFWRTIRDDVALDVAIMDTESIAELLGPTPSAGGMIPKLLVAIPDAPDWDGSFARPGTRSVDGRPYVDVVLKVEPAEYRGLAELEALCLDLHRQAGFEVPRWWRATLDGLELLAVERFDRSADGLPVPMETLYSVFATGRREFNANQDTDLAEMAGWLEKLAAVVNLDVRAVQREIYRRLTVALCTGNGDMHLQNLSFLGGPERVYLAPVYDPSPMRAWPQHDVRLAIPMDFDDRLGGFGENWIALGARFGLTRGQAKERVVWALEVTRAYGEQVQALATVPSVRRERLAAVVGRERDVLNKALNTA